MKWNFQTNYESVTLGYWKISFKYSSAKIFYVVLHTFPNISYDFKNVGQFDSLFTGILPRFHSERNYYFR